MRHRRVSPLALTILTLLVFLAGGVAWKMHVQLQRESLRLPLIEAVIHQNSNEVQALLENGADPNARSNPPIQIRFRDLWRHLWRHTPTERISPYPTALMLASQLGDLASMKALLDHGADPNARIPDDRTALLIAAQYEQIKAVRLL